MEEKQCGPASVIWSVLFSSRNLHEARQQTATLVRAQDPLQFDHVSGHVMSEQIATIAGSAQPEPLLNVLIVAT
jgi:hypothetical protein